jgi:hypothetical protein
MDFNKLIARVKAILLSPRTEWPVIAAEEATVGGLYRNYIVWLTGVAALASFISMSIIGRTVWVLGMFRVGIMAGLMRAIVSWALVLLFVWLFAWLVDALAPTFGGQKNRVQALKAVAYSFTAGWVASIAVIVPGLGGLIALVGLVYGIYLLYLGLPQTMKCPPEKAAGYTAVTVVIAIVVAWILSAVVWGVMGRSGFAGMGGSDVKLEQWTKGMEEAGKRMEAAGKSGDSAAAAQAVGGMLAAAVGSKDGPVEALAPDRVKSFLPESLGKLARTEVNAERSGAMGIQVSTAEAHYSDNAGQDVELKITDLGGASGLAALASWAGIEQDRQTQSGYEKTYKSDGQVIHEQWDNDSKHGEYFVLVGNRFSVEASGNTASIDTLKAAVNSVDLGALAALRNEGVKTN